MDEPLSDPLPEELLMVVVGAHLRAEVADRPLAEGLRHAIIEHQQRTDLAGPRPVVCSDLWYLNDQELMRRPTIAIGVPEVNAATAYLGNKLQTSFVIEGSLRILHDPDYVDLRACLWGVSTASTAAAIQVFRERYLDTFLQRAELAAAG